MTSYHEKKQLRFMNYAENAKSTAYTKALNIHLKNPIFLLLPQHKLYLEKLRNREFYSTGKTWNTQGSKYIYQIFPASLQF